MFKSNKDDKEKVKKSLPREILEWIGTILSAFLLAVFIKYFIFTPTLVQMSSMYPTIFSGERVFVNRLARTFKLRLNRGDIVTFEAPAYDEGAVARMMDGEVTAVYNEVHGFQWFTYNMLEIGKTSYIKRVIGVSGDRIQIQNGKVYLNGELLDESSYLPDDTETTIRTNGIKDDFVVPAGYVFCMGDNRTGSQDCRAFGCIPIDKVEGRVVFRMLPLSRFGAINKSGITKEEVDEYNAERAGLKI